MFFIFFWILLALYLMLILVYAFTVFQPATTTRVQPWSFITGVAADLHQKRVLSCPLGNECPEDYVCLDKTCIPKLQRGGICDKTWGNWISYPFLGYVYAICDCKRDDIYLQKYFGSNCDVLVACSGHGTFNGQFCQCSEGYVHGSPNRLTCVKAPVVKRDYIPGQVRLNDDLKKSFHPSYLEKNTSKFVTKPCKFDALTGKPLRNGFFRNGRCVCDPRYGLFGVHLKGTTDKTYLNTQHPDAYDACASIYQDESHPNIHVKLITYYYLGDSSPPVSFIKFSHLTDLDKIQPELLKAVKEDSLIIGQNWKQSYMHHVFEEGAYTARIRYCSTILFVKQCYEHVYEDNYKSIPCHELADHIKSTSDEHTLAYELMYRFPVCFLPKEVVRRRGVDDMFADSYVMQPNLLAYPDYKELFRTNGLALTFKSGRWIVNYEEGYNLETYKNIKTNAPVVHDRVRAERGNVRSRYGV